MGKLIADNPNAQIIGGAVLAMIRSVRAEDYRHILTRHGLGRIDPAEWYSQELILDIHRDILSRSGGSIYDFVSIGMKLGDSDVIPSKSLTEALLNLEPSHQMIHRNISSMGYMVEVISDQRILVTDMTPYPHDLIYGMIYAIVGRHKPEESAATTRRQDILAADTADSPPTIYEISW